MTTPYEGYVSTNVLSGQELISVQFCRDNSRIVRHKSDMTIKKTSKAPAQIYSFLFIISSLFFKKALLFGEAGL
ncbi:MAG: hypothetical protein IKL41_01340 [Clostridia bacterium]|nr:hypothetical protein [Clostridia bacterium]